MDSTKYDGYEIFFLKKPEHEGDMQFISDFVAQLFAEFSIFLSDSFILKVGEFHCGHQEYTWQIQVQSTGLNIEETSPLIRVCSTQNYSAESRLECYDGRIEIDATVPIAQAIEWFSNLPAKTLARLAYAHYYEKIKTYYPEWTTHYIDSPKYTIFPNVIFPNV